jgi:hypothetical protein
MVPEKAAFETITGEWAKSKDFINVEIKVLRLNDGRVEVIFRK